MGLCGLLVALAIAAEVLFYRVKDALFTKGPKMTKNETPADHKMRVSQWLADAAAWGNTLTSQDWRKYPLRGLIGALGSSSKDADCEGIAAAALRLCEVGDPRFQSLPKGDAAQCLSESHGILSTGVIWKSLIGLGPDEVHCAIVLAMGRICDFADPHGTVRGTERQITTAATQIVCLAWALEELNKSTKQ